MRILRRLDYSSYEVVESMYFSGAWGSFLFGATDDEKIHNPISYIAEHTATWQCLFLGRPAIQNWQGVATIVDCYTLKRLPDVPEEFPGW